VKAQETFLLEVTADEWWENVTLPMLETARLKMRLLVQFADRKFRPVVQTNLADTAGETTEVTLPELEGVTLHSHEKKVRAFLDEHKKNNPTIVKLRANQPLTRAELQELDRLLFEVSGFESRTEFEKYFGAQPDLGKFVRGAVGMDRGAAKAAFGEFLSGSKYNSAQIDFINGVIDYLTERGTIKISQLYDPPITSHPDGVEGIFPRDYDSLLSIVRSINANASAS
jgi:type I restriction enzyme R subunit